MAFFIADIGANHDGNLDRAKELIRLAKESGANAVKFQYWETDKFINDNEFKNIKLKSHQANWKHSVYETYKKYQLPFEWIPVLSEYAHKLDLKFSVSIYDIDKVDEIDKYCDFHKIGSGDITYFQLLAKIANKMKFVLLGTGASNLQEVINAANVILNINPQLCLMQCNTNYTNDRDNEKHINLNVLKSYKTYFPNISVGISDHTKNSSIISAGLCLGVDFFERHFTDGKSESPDNIFALTPIEWTYMVNQANETLKLLGNTFKMVEQNEIETNLLQRRCLYATKEIKKGQIIDKNDFIAMRPVVNRAVLPIINLNGYQSNRDIGKGKPIFFDDINF